MRLTRLQNEAAVTKVSAIKIGRMRPLPEVYSIPIPEQVCPQRNAVVRLLKLTTETGPASNWRRPVILRLRCVSLWLQQNGRQGVVADDCQLGRARLLSSHCTAETHGSAGALPSRNCTTLRIAMLAAKTDDT